MPDFWLAVVEDFADVDAVVVDEVEVIVVDETAVDVLPSIRAALFLSRARSASRSIKIRARRNANGTSWSLAFVAPFDFSSCFLRFSFLLVGGTACCVGGKS